MSKARQKPDERWKREGKLAPTLAAAGAAQAGAAPAVSVPSLFVADKVRRTLVLTAAAVVWLVLVDAVVAAVSLPLAYWLRHGSAVLVWPDGSLLPADVANSFRPYLSLVLAIPLIRFFTLKHYGLYRLRGEFSLLSDAVALFKAVTVGTLVLVLFAMLYRGGFKYNDYSYSRFVFVIDWALVLAATGAVRFGVRTAQTLQRRHERNLIPTLIVGDGEVARLC